MREGPKPSVRRYLPRAQVYFEPIPALLALGRGTSAGREVARFEAEVAKIFRCAHAITTSHARIALYHVLQVLQLPPGSEVLVTPVTIPDVINAIILRGLQPVFADLAPRTCNVDIASLEKRRTPRTRAVLVTHLCGFPSDMDSILDFCRRHDCELIEDISQAFMATWKGRPLGTFGRAGICSLTTLKTVGTFHGGLVVTDDAALAREVRRWAEAAPPTSMGTLAGWWVRDTILYLATDPRVFRWVTRHILALAADRWPEAIARVQRGSFGPWKGHDAVITRRDHFPEALFRRFTDAQATIGLRALRAMPEGNRRRLELGQALLDGLKRKGVMGIPKVLPDGVPTFWRFPWWPENRARARARLWDYGVDAAPTNLPCLSREEAFAPFAAPCPHAEAYCDQMLFLPLYPRMTMADVNRIVAAVERCQ